MRNLKKNTAEFYDRGYLPHYNGGDIWQSLTLRVTGSLPAVVLKQIEQRSASAPVEKRNILSMKLKEQYLDMTAQSGVLANSDYAQVVVDVLSRFDGELYDLAAYVVMSNHLHMLFCVINGKDIDLIVKMVKSRSARIINRLRGIFGCLWERDYFDRYIRNYEHWYNVLQYIENNPVKCGLCKSRQEYKYSSAFERDALFYPSPTNYKLNWK